MKVFRLSEPEHGWIDITFGHEPDCYTMRASVVPNDCLRDLAAATTRLLRGAVDETVEFSLEPDFATCQLHRDLESVRIVIRHPDRDAPVFTDSFPLRSFAQRVRFELLGIQARYSAEDGWTRPFPNHEVTNLA